METQTHTPVKYEDLTPAQKRAIVNGCGGKGGIVKPPHRIFFDTSCNHHDYGYFKGCTEADRLADDKELKKSMKKDCATLPWYRQIRYRPWCWLYYRGVRIVGKKYFYYGDTKRFPKTDRS